MELRVLNYFLMVAREENITKAANLLHVTQPTLSRQLMQLEEELGVKLFTRSSHSIFLTDEGMLLKRRAQEMLSLADKTKQELSHKEEQLAGDIAIGAGELRSMNCFAEVMTAFQKEHPLIHFDIYSGNVDNIKDRVDQGLIDIALFSEPVDIMKYEFIRMPLKEIWGVLVREDSELAKKDVVVPKDLIGIPLMATNRLLVQNELMNWFGEYADELNFVTTYNLIYNAAIMVQKGGGAAFSLELEYQFAKLKFIPISPGWALGSVLAWKKNQTFSKAAAAFILYMKECFSKK